MKKFKGVIVPMVTPLNEDYSIDARAVEKMIATIIRTDAVPFILGTTGESASLSQTQKLDLVKYTVNAVSGKCRIFAGISGTSLIESVECAQAYRDMGVDILVSTLPYYFPIEPVDMIRYFDQLANEIDSPLMLYNMPAMVGESIPLTVAQQLSKHPNIVGMKDSERDIQRLNESIELWKDREDFGFYIGWAAQSAHGVLNGADGIVPSTANLVPDLYDQLYRAACNGEQEGAFELQRVTDELSSIYQKGRKLNTSLPALKVILAEQGICQATVMPPLYNISQDECIKIKQTLQKH